MSAPDDAGHMRHALGLGARGLGTTWPNPSVGCVIVQGGRIVGRGWTRPGGRPHAEVVALGQAGDAARGAVAYVTLEPCAHQGQTAPCAVALIDAGVARVVTAMEDPDPRVAGRGHAMLRAAGIIVTEGVETEAARFAHAGFLRRVTTGLPAVTLKLATSLDGRIATEAGESRWITGPLARRMVHALRLRHDAVMVGAATARADDPDLTVRDMGVLRQPVRIVIDTALTLDAGSRLGRTARDAPVWLCHGDAASAEAMRGWRQTGARLFACPGRDGSLDLAQTLRLLAGAGLTRILCEGGGRLAAALLRADLVTELVAFTAGNVIGAGGVPAIGDLGLTALAAAPRFDLVETAGLSGDVMTRWRKA